jgi:glycosyltransferase 2 family protein
MLRGQPLTRHLRAVIGALISLVALFFALRGINPRAVWSAVLAANYPWLIVGILLVCLSIVLRARRWRAFFSNPERLPFGLLFGVLNVGYLVNNLLPLRAGELVRIWLLGQRDDVSRAEALATIVVERLVDTLSVIILLGMVAPFIPVPHAAARPVLLLAAMMLLLAALLLIVATQRATALRLVGWGSRLLPERLRGGLSRQADAAIDGLAALRNPRAAAEVAVLSALVYLTLGASMAAQLMAFHIRLGIAAPFFVLATATLGLVIPASPGAIGIWEGVVIAALTGAFSIDRNLATGVALVTHVIFFSPPMFLGAAYVWRVGVSWGRLLGLPAAEEARPSLR